MTEPAIARTVVFIHGLWLHATSWQLWIERFREEGHAPVAPGWPGDPAKVNTANESRGPLVDGGWREVADASLSWLPKQGL
jgi:hypothetical protein